MGCFPSPRLFTGDYVFVWKYDVPLLFLKLWQVFSSIVQFHLLDDRCLYLLWYPNFIVNSYLTLYPDCPNLYHKSLLVIQIWVVWSVCLSQPERCRKVGGNACLSAAGVVSSHGGVTTSTVSSETWVAVFAVFTTGPHWSWYQFDGRETT